MRSRSVVTASVAAAVLALAACGPGTSGGSDDATGARTPPPDEQPTAIDLPEDAVLGLVGIATAPNGATADLAVIVHATLPYLVPEAAEAMQTTLDWCAGELDETVVSGRGFSFTAVDVSLTPRDGTWPADVTLAVLTKPNPEFGSTIAAGPGLRQVAATDSDGVGDDVPHCLRPAVLDGTGAGTVYLGIPNDIAGANDAESFTAWARSAFGLSSLLPGDLGDAGVAFSSCLANITQLGTEFGAPSTAWAESFEGSGCVVGDVSGLG